MIWFFEMNLTEKQIWEKIQEGFIKNGDQNGIISFTNDIISFLPLKELDWWIYDFDQFSSVPKYNKERFIGFLKKILPCTLLPYKTAGEVSKWEEFRWFY